MKTFEQYVTAAEDLVQAAVEKGTPVGEASVGVGAAQVMATLALAVITENGL